MQAFFSSEGSYALQFLVIFLVILVLFLLAAMLFMRLSGRGLTLSASAGQRGRQPRLGIADIYELDRQRQLILLRRDNVEHLLLVGGPNDVVIERHIQRGAGSRYAPEGSRAGGEIGAAEAGALEPPRTDPFLDSPMPPTFAMPEVVPAAVPGAQPAPDRAPPLDPGLFEPEVTPADAPPRPASPVSRLIRRTAPPVVAPRPDLAAERSPRREPASAEPAPDPVPEPPPVMASRGPRSVDPAVLSDMARQLQVALKRPSSAVTPPPGGAPETPSPAPAEAASPTPDPVAAAMAAAPPVPPVPTAPAPQAPAPRPQETPPIPAASPPRPEPTPPVKPVAPPTFVAPPRPEPKAEPAKAEAPKPEAPRSEPPRSEPPKSEPGRSEPAKAEPSEPGAQGQNPFSVEEIEAEFARLLGRPLDSKN